MRVPAIGYSSPEHCGQTGALPSSDFGLFSPRVRPNQGAPLDVGRFESDRRATHTPKQQSQPAAPAVFNVTHEHAAIAQAQNDACSRRELGNAENDPAVPPKPVERLRRRRALGGPALPSARCRSRTEAA